MHLSIELNFANMVAESFCESGPFIYMEVLFMPVAESSEQSCVADLRSQIEELYREIAAKEDAIRQMQVSRDVCRSHNRALEASGIVAQYKGYLQDQRCMYDDLLERARLRFVALERQYSLLVSLKARQLDPSFLWTKRLRVLLCQLRLLLSGEDPRQIPKAADFHFPPPHC